MQERKSFGNGYKQRCRLSVLVCSLVLCGLCIGQTTHAQAGAATATSSLPASTDIAVVNDAATSLQWTASDNGTDIDWKAAQSFCAAKPGWRLPDSRELLSLYSGSVAKAAVVGCGASACHAAPQFKLTAAWFWSSEAVGADAYDGIELAWGVSLVNGKRTQSVQELSYGSRALCVRKL